jgi:alpha-methylacyl-CoA racemase
LLALCGADDPDLQKQWSQRDWPQLKVKFAALFKSRTRDEWCGLLEGTDACFAPVLDMAEAPTHPHNQARGTFVEVDGVTQPAPAPRFSRTAVGKVEPVRDDSAGVLADWGWEPGAIEALRSAKVI